MTAYRRSGFVDTALQQRLFETCQRTGLIIRVGGIDQPLSDRHREYRERLSVFDIDVMSMHMTECRRVQPNHTWESKAIRLVGRSASPIDRLDRRGDVNDAGFQAACIVATRAMLPHFLVANHNALRDEGQPFAYRVFSGNAFGQIALRQLGMHDGQILSEVDFIVWQKRMRGETITDAGRRHYASIGFAADVTPRVAEELSLWEPLDGLIDVHGPIETFAGVDRISAEFGRNPEFYRVWQDLFFRRHMAAD